MSDYILSLAFDLFPLSSSDFIIIRSSTKKNYRKEKRVSECRSDREQFISKFRLSLQSLILFILRIRIPLYHLWFYCKFSFVGLIELWTKCWFTVEVTLRLKVQKIWHVFWITPICKFDTIAITVKTSSANFNSVSRF